MDHGLNWYKREPRAFLDGVRSANLSSKEMAVYSILIDLIYEGGGKTPNHPKYIAGHFSDLGTASVRRIIEHLISVGKLIVEGDYLTQKRAKNEAKTNRKLSETRSVSGRLGGVLSGVSRRKTNENNGTDEASALSKRQAEKRREEKKEKRDTKVSPKKSPKIELEKVLSPEHSKAVIEHRAKLRKPLTERAAKLLADKFARCPDPNAASDAMISNGWQGFEPDWLERKQATRRDQNPAHALADKIRAAQEANNEHPEQIGFENV